MPLVILVTLDQVTLETLTATEDLEVNSEASNKDLVVNLEANLKDLEGNSVPVVHLDNLEGNNSLDMEDLMVMGHVVPMATDHAVHKDLVVIKNFIR